MINGRLKRFTVFEQRISPKKHELVYSSVWNGTEFVNGPIPDGYPASIQLAYDFYSIDVPLKANCNFGKKRLRWCAGAGIAANVFLLQNVRSKNWYVDGSTDRDSNNSQFNYNGITLSPQLNAGINYHVNEKMYFKAEPTFRYGIINIIDAPVTGYLWNAGLNLGWYFGK